MQNERLAALQIVALSLTSTLELDQVLARVVELAQTLSAAAHSHIFLYDRERDDLTLAASHWSSEQRQFALKPRAGGITATVARTGEPAFISDTYAHAAYADVPTERKPGAVACLPLVKDARVLGTLSLGYWEPHPFDADTRNFLNLLAQHAALAIDNARLHALAIEKARMERELEMARAVQASLMPRTTPQIAGWEFAAFWRPAHIVSGDMYDFFALPELHGEALQTISIADVADKGMPAALFMALTRATLRASIAMRCCPTDCVEHTNRVLYQDATDGMFVTLCYAQLDTARGELTYVNAGHTYPLWYQCRTDEIFELNHAGMALGIDAAQSYQESVIHLQPGDFVLFYTDGVTDATDAQVNAFGKARLCELLRENGRASASEIAAAMEDSLREFVDGAAQFDDITAVIVKRN